MSFHITKRLAIFAVLALLLAACGSGENASDDVLAPAATAEIEPTPVPTTEPVAVPADEPDEPDEPDESIDAGSEEAGSGATDSEASGATVATTTTPPTAAAGSTLVAVNAAQWSSNVSIQINDDSFVFSSNGFPSHELPDQFLVPTDGNMPPFSDDDLDADFNIANTSELITESPLTETITLTPVYSETVTLTDLSTIGVTISGVPLFNDYEDMGREFVALDDNLSLNGVFFIDACNGHPLADGRSYHYHGVPYCITDTIDVAGQHSTVLGFLLDGFPVYGSKDAGGVTITTGELDECSGHFGPTPEFPDGIYHYHLTEDMAPYSIDCFHGEIDYSGGGPGGGGGERPEGGPPQGAPPEGAEGGTPPEGAPPEGTEGGTPPEGAPPEGTEGGTPPEGAPPEDGGQGAPLEDGGQGGPPSDGERPAGGPGGGGQAPDFAAAAAALGITEDALRNALGGPPPDFDGAAAALGISVTDLQAALDAAS